MDFYVGLVTNSNLSAQSSTHTTSHIHEKYELLVDGLKNTDFAEIMMFLDTLTYLTDDICTKVDRAAMANSLEVRAPFLNHQVVELGWSTPLSDKIKNGSGKQILKSILGKYVPSELIDLPKKGFSIPLAQWLRGDLKDWVETIIKNGDYAHAGLDKEAFSVMWRHHIDGSRDFSGQIWALVMLFSWLGTYSQYLKK
jgi:asparagine synthase (glutamine-hydrolysing)